MVLACGNRVQFYASIDLKSWIYLSDFGTDEGCHAHVWECPYLFELSVDNESYSNGFLRLTFMMALLRGDPAGSILSVTSMAISL